jgi:hypothetical protein
MTKLLEANDGELLDTRAPGTTSRANQELETMAAFHRSTDGEG